MAQTIGLLKKENKKETLTIISLLTKLTIDYNGNINLVYNTLNKLKEKYKDYNNFINNYFEKTNYLYLFLEK